MKKILTCFVFAICNTALLNAQSLALTRYVNPFIGTGGHGHTYPGATVPFGMVQLSPDNGTEGWDWSSGYHYSDTVIAGFSHTHLSGTGIGDWCDISVMPFAETKVENINDTGKIRSNFLHQNEKASPGFYQVQLNNKIDVSLTASNRSAMHQYQFPEGMVNGLRFDLGFTINWDAVTESFLWSTNNNSVEGYRISTGWAKNQRVYFSSSFSKPIYAISYYVDGKLFFPNKNKPMGLGWPKGKNIKAVLLFDNPTNEKVVMKIGLSSVNIENARLNREEYKDFDFEKMKNDAGKLWETELSKIKIEATDDIKTIFYTAMYHTMLSPNLFSDIDDNFKNQQGVLTKEKRYTIFSLWDTFRALHPLYSLFQPKRNTEFINSMLSFCDQNGKLPVWDISTWEANTMTGYHAVPVIADAILKGAKGFDYNRAFRAMMKSASQQVRGTPEFVQYGFVPQDKHGWSATMTLEYAFDDWCIAQVAKKLNKQKEFEFFMKRAAAYKNIFDPNTGFMRAKNSDGKFVTPFDPYLSEHGFEGNYIEGTAWQHSFFVPHDIKGFAKLYPNAEGLEEKLDSLFTVTSKMNGENVSVDVSGLIGQYAHGNEPSHHIAYMYNYLGAPQKTQEKVRLIVDSMYKNKVDGLAGNDDCGQMSAWYIWTALGMYPVNPANGEYVFGSPLINKAVLDVQNGKTFTIVVKNNSKENKYISSIRLNGKIFTQLYITHQDIMKGGSLEITMNNIPSARIALLYKKPSSMTN